VYFYIVVGGCICWRFCIIGSLLVCSCIINHMWNVKGCVLLHCWIVGWGVLLHKILRCQGGRRRPQVLLASSCRWYGTTCIYVSCIGAYHIDISLKWCMWMTVVVSKCVWWIYTRDICNCCVYMHVKDNCSW